jgi:hypothetical protein
LITNSRRSQPLFVEGRFAYILPAMRKELIVTAGTIDSRALNQIVQIAGRDGPKYG